MSLDIYEKSRQELKGWFYPESFRVFSEILVAQKHNNVKGDILEIGAYYGQSATTLAYHLQEGEKLYCNDLFEHPENQQVWNIRNDRKVYLKPPTSKEFLLKLSSIIPDKISSIVPIVAPSRELPKLVGKQQFRFIHIDGFHDYKTTLLDLEFSMKHIFPGGVVALDDWRNADWPEVGRSFIYFLHKYKTRVSVKYVEDRKIYFTVEN